MWIVSKLAASMVACHTKFSLQLTVVKGVWGDQVPLQDLDFQKYFTEQGIVERSAVFYRKY